MNLSPDPDSRGPHNREENSGHTQEIVRQVRCVAFPVLYEDDLWLDKHNGKRWVISAIQPVAEIKGVPLIYRLQLSLIPMSDVIYKSVGNVLAQSQPVARPTGTEYSWYNDLSCRNEF